MCAVFPAQRVHQTFNTLRLSPPFIHSRENEGAMRDGKRRFRECGGDRVLTRTESIRSYAADKAAVPAENDIADGAAIRGGHRGIPNAWITRCIKDLYKNVE